MKTLLSKIALVAFATGFSICAAAQNFEQLICKDQSVYEGYIVEQKAGKSMTIFAQQATIVIKKSAITAPMTTTFQLSDLTEEWQQWVKENKPEGTSELTLKSFSSNGISYNNVYVIEDGSYITFLDIAKRKHTIPWANVYSTTKTLRPENEFSGVNDVVTTKSGDVYVGQITEQCLGQYLKMRTEDGMNVSISPSDLASTAVASINEKLPLFSQARLLDVIEVDGQKIEGIITSREFGKLLCLQLKDGRVREFPIAKVTTYGKRINPDYISLTDRIMNKGDIYLDGVKIEMDSLIRRDIGLVVTDSTYIIKNKGQKFMLEVAHNDVYCPVTAVKTKPIVVYKLNEEGKQDRSLGREIVTVAKYEDMVNAPIAVKRSVSPLGNINIEYTLEDEGIYVIYINGYEQGIVIKVE